MTITVLTEEERRAKFFRARHHPSMLTIGEEYVMVDINEPEITKFVFNGFMVNNAVTESLYFNVSGHGDLYLADVGLGPYHEVCGVRFAGLWNGHKGIYLGMDQALADFDIK